MDEESLLEAELIGGDKSTELSASRTAMSLERTALAIDRTLMAVERTSLSLIGFGFTIFQFFHRLKTEFLDGVLPAGAPRRFGVALIVIGVLLLTMGIGNYVRSMHRLRTRRARLLALGLVHPEEEKRFTPAELSAVLLLVVGLFAILSVAFRIGPF